MSVSEQFQKLEAHVASLIVGQEHLINRMLIALLCDGHLIVEGAPGLAKTRAIKVLAESVEGSFHRLQFTPDLLPADLTGTDIYRPQDGTFEFREGPLFHSLILADEINRAPAKVQSALLEAMEERQITVGEGSYKLPNLFMVMATQNPIEQEGTYPLPEAQMDRFLLHVYIDYGTEEAEAQVIRLVRSEEGSSTSATNEEPVIQQVIFDARREINRVQVSQTIEKYIVDLVFATRYPGRYDEKLASWIRIGASPRGAIGLDKCARVHAWLNGRDQVLPDDVRAVVHGVLRHRIALSYEANADGVSSNDVINEILKLVAVA